MEEKDYKKLMDEILRGSKNDVFPIYDTKEDRGYQWGDWIETKEVSREIPMSIEDVLRKFKPEELIEAIGIEKVDSILRAHKIKLLKKKIKK